MSKPSRRRHTLAAALLAAAGALPLTVAVPVGRQASDVNGRLELGQAALSALDSGLASQSAVAEPADRRLRAAFSTDGAASTAAPYDRREVIVKFRTEDEAPRREAMRVVGGRGMRRPAHADFDLLAIPDGSDPEDIARLLAARGDVEYAQARYRNDALFRPTDPLYSRQWNFPAIDMERAWDINPGASSNVTVAVLDSGVAFRSTIVRYTGRAVRLVAGGPVYPALGPVDVPFAAANDLGDAGRFVAPRDFIWNDALPLDLDGHGTHVAGTIGQATNNGAGVAGMAFNVRIMPVKVLSDVWDFIFSNDAIGTDDVVAQGIRYAADNGAHVINMSLGRETGQAAPAVRAAVEYAVSRDVFVVIAAGNDATTGNRPNRAAEFAATIDGAVAVGAVGRTLNRAFYSTTGSYVEIAAPGGDSRQAGTLSEGGILQQMVDQDLAHTWTLPPALFRAPRFDVYAYYYNQGTSMAAPHVAGFAALLRQQGLTKPAAIEAAMKQFATDRGAAGRDDEYGYGLINPRATLRGLGLAR